MYFWLPAPPVQRGGLFYGFSRKIIVHVYLLPDIINDSGVGVRCNKIEECLT